MSSLISHGLFIVDSVVELSPRDTTTRVRFVRATSVARAETRVTDTFAVRDTMETASLEIPKIPIAVESKKKGLASLCATAEWLAWLFAAIFFVVLVVCVKKSLFLRRQ